jgi:hypothetical protein
MGLKIKGLEELSERDHQGSFGGVDLETDKGAICARGIEEEDM